MIFEENNFFLGNKQTNICRSVYKIYFLLPLNKGVLVHGALRNTKMKEFNTVLKVSLILTIVIVLLNLLVNFGEPVLMMDLFEMAGISFIYCFVLTAVGSSFHSYASRKYSWETQAVKRLWFGAIGSVILTVIAFGLVRWFIKVIIYNNTFEEFVENESVINYIVALVITLVISLFIHAFYFWKALQDTKIKEQ